MVGGAYRSQVWGNGWWGQIKAYGVTLWGLWQVGHLEYVQDGGSIWR